MKSSTLALSALPLFGLLVAGASLAHQEALELRATVSKIDVHVMVPAPQAARIMSLGANELAADLAWVRTLIYYGDGLIHNTGMPDVELLVALINALDPRFRQPYLWGGYSTTYRQQVATQKEFKASVEILRRGVAQLPGDWELAFLLGQRLYFDLKPEDEEVRHKLREEGAYYIERAMRLPGAPPDLATTAAAMRTKLGQKDRALRELREMILTTEDEKAREKLQARYVALASEGAGADLAAEVKQFDASWRATLPYVPRSLFILVGPRPAPDFDLRRLVAGDQFGPSGDENEPSSAVNIDGSATPGPE